MIINTTMMIFVYLLSLYSTLFMTPRFSPPTVQSVVKEHIIHLGGEEKLEKLKTQYIEQRIMINNTSLFQTLYIRENEQVYQKTHSTAIGSIIEFYSKENNWKKAPYINSGKQTSLEKQEIETLEQKTHISGLLYEYYKENIKPQSIRIVEYPKSNRDLYYVLQMTIGKDILTYHIHKNTWMIDKLVVNNDVTITYHDYKQNQGFWFPYSKMIDIHHNITKIEITKMKINERLQEQDVVWE